MSLLLSLRSGAPFRTMMVAALMAGAATIVAATAVRADGAAPAGAAPLTAEQRDAEVTAAWEAAGKVATNGPASVRLLDQGDLALSQNRAFVPAAEAARVLRAYGNVPGQNLVGLVVGTGQDDTWMTVVRFTKEGYIKDDDAKDWNADDLMASIKEGTAQANEDRVSRGFPRQEIVGWVEKPAYDVATHRLVWSLSSRAENQSADGNLGINYNTYALGREGYFSLNLLTSLKDVEAQKPVAHALLAGLNYDLGKRYEDFNASTDKVAAYGLAALVGGVALKKAGVFALAFAFLAKFGKVAFLAIAGLGLGVARLFRRKKAEA